MMTSDRLREMMEQSLRSPMDLCDRLGLTPNEAQLQMMHDFHEGANPLRVANDVHYSQVYAAAVCALWNTLRKPSSRCLVIASDPSLNHAYAEFLYKLTSSVDPALASVCKWRGKTKVTIGRDLGWSIIMLPANAKMLTGLGFQPSTHVALGVGDSDPAFVEAAALLASKPANEHHQVIEVW